MPNENTISVKDQQIDVADLPQIAEQLIEEHKRRKKKREPREKIWDEIDRQLKMEPEKSHKMTANNKVDKKKAWLPETELPWQSQTLEMLTSDCRRLIFPRGQEWFLARAALTADYIDKFNNAETPIVHEKGRFEGGINQDNGDRIVSGSLNFYHRQYNLKGHMDLINAEALSYGFGVGRLREVNKRIMGYELKGRKTTGKVPMLIPRSARHVYPDDSAHAIMHEGHELGPNVIQGRKVKLADLNAAALSDDSYIKEQLARLTADDNGEVLLVELEGDLVYETSRETVIVRDVEITAAAGTGENDTYGMIRYQPADGSTYLIFDYHLENASTGVATSPLVKGQPIDKIAAQIMNDLIASGRLKTLPPVSYSPDDPEFAASGGPVIEPQALWETSDGVTVNAEVGGDPAVFFNIFGGMKEMYDDATGMNSPRLGAQTKSHTTAFAKDAELSQGAVRTVDYVDQTLDAPLTRFLEMEYRFALKHWKKEVVFVDAWNEFIELERAHLPDIAAFKALGDATTISDLQAQQRKLNAIQLALQVDSIAIQLGREPHLEHGKIIDSILHDGGVQDLSEVTAEESPDALLGKQTGQIPGVLSGELQ